MSLMLMIARWTQPNFRKIAADTGRLQLVTIFLSHYVEFARWALLIKGVKFDEHDYEPGIHVLPVISLRVDSNGKKHLSKSSRPGDKPLSEEAKAEKKGALSAVPVAALPDQSLLLDSWEIASYSGLKPIEPDFKRFLDEEIGVVCRIYAYSFLLKHKNRSALDNAFTSTRGILFKIIWFLFLGNIMANELRKMFKALDKDHVAKCRSQVASAFAKVDKMLLEKKTKYLSGSDTEPGVADIALASLAAPLVAAPGYANGALESAYDALAKSDPEFVEELKYWRSTETGRFIMNLYAEHRKIMKK